MSGVMSGREDWRAAPFPVIDFAPVPGEATEERRRRLGEAAVSAWGEWGAFCAVNHGCGNAGRALQRELRAFFALSDKCKLACHVAKGGAAWRGYMPLRGEETHGAVDWKEGLYLGADHRDSDERVAAGVPLFGRNLLPDEAVPDLRPAIARYVEEVGAFGQTLMQLVSVGLGLPEGYMRKHFTEEPLALLRAFNYPPQPQPPTPQKEPGGDDNPEAPAQAAVRWGIGEHTDYGLLTMLLADAPGLQFRHPEHGWVDVPTRASEEGWLVCSAGDVMDRMSDGRLKSRPHRARNLRDAGEPRLSIPYFFDPSWSAQMHTLPLGHLMPHFDPGKGSRWKATNILRLEGPYSDFLAKKVAKVFPELVTQRVLGTLTTTRNASTRHRITVDLDSRNRVRAVLDATAGLRHALRTHRVYGLADDLASLRALMAVHVFAVWDFMSLAKALQRMCTCVDVPWVPPADPWLARTINTLVLEEETDETDDKGAYLSHFELYLKAMEQAGADTGPITRFVDALRAGVGVSKALAESGAPAAAARFVEHTLRVAQSGQLHIVAAVFTFGREDVVPEMFEGIVDRVAVQADYNLNRLRFYLRRHIEVDAEDHGPLAFRMVERVCGDSDAKWRDARAAAEAALRERVALWDGAAEAMAAARREGAASTPVETPPRKRKHVDTE